tara:strand:+ start:26413 stop:27645 length:1233 start_codon:yes stop_codon:yes gene_type:complete
MKNKLTLISKKQPLKGTVKLPGSKSLSNRALVIEAIANQGKFVKNVSNARDSELMAALVKLNTGKLDCEMAGTTLRFLMAHYAAKPGVEVILTGHDRLLLRPIKALVEALKALGADISYVRNPGFPPVKILGQKLEGGETTITGKISSQFISALAMIAPNFEKGLTIKIEGDLVSAPYLHMTLELMRHFGAEAKFENNAVKITNQCYIMKPYTVESDWSAASYWYAFAALSPESAITLRNIRKGSLQGDAVCSELFHTFGVETIEKGKDITLQSSGEEAPASIEMNLLATPDLAQTLAVVIAAKKMKAKLTGLQTLQLKETKRLTALKNELEKFDVKVDVIDNKELEIDATNFMPNKVEIETYNDHRMAMAFAPLALVCDEVTLTNPDVVGKSYPNFWKELEKVEGLEQR